MTFDLSKLGWGPFFQQQLSLEEIEETIACRVMAVHRGQLTLSMNGQVHSLPIAGKIIKEHDENPITVGDWVLVSNHTREYIRLLDRNSLIKRQAAGSDKSQQLVAANINTVFIVTSCNEDFNLSRLERYLAFAYAADVFPVIVLNKKDLCDDPEEYLRNVRTLGANIIVEAVNAHDPATLDVLQVWCKPGQTIALLGSSGVGKSTLVNALGAEHQKTGGIRTDDAKGRHTTTHRSLLPLQNGAVLLDSPGMRGIGMTESGEGIASAFEDIVELSKTCRFSDCQHDQEPGCAVKTALENDELSERRLRSYNKLLAEQERNDATIAEHRKKAKETVKYHKKVQSHQKSLKGH